MGECLWFLELTRFDDILQWSYVVMVKPLPGLYNWYDFPHLKRWQGYDQCLVQSLPERMRALSFCEISCYALILMLLIPERGGHSKANSNAMSGVGRGGFLRSARRIPLSARRVHGTW